MRGYELILPMGPSINHYYLRNGNGGLRISDVGKEFRLEVWAAVKQSRMPKLRGQLAAVFRIYPSSRRMQDVSNRIKPLVDALQMAGAFENDEQFDDLHVLCGPVVSGGRIEVLIGEIEEFKATH